MTRHAGSSLTVSLPRPVARRQGLGRLLASRRSQVGMTYIEMIVALGIFALLITLSFETSMFTTRAASEMITLSTLEVKGERTLKLVVESLTSSANLGVDETEPGPKGAGLDYYVPRDTDSSGTVLQGQDQANPGNLEYGVVTETAEGAGTMRFEFITERTIVEANEDLDLNGDGDTNDSFDMGYIQRSTSLASDLPKVIGVNNIIQRAGSTHWGQSILYDEGTAEAGADLTGRIFYLASGSEMLQVNIYLLNISEDRTANLILSRGQVFLRNQGNE